MLETGDTVGFAGYFREFFRNDALSGFWAEGDMFADFLHQRWWRKRLRADLMDRQMAVWREAFPETSFSELAAPDIGSPWGYEIGGYTVYEPACEYHLQAGLFGPWLSRLDKPVVLEIGGGFGGLAYFLKKRCPHVRYIGLDLPENVALQTYYLAKAFPDARVLSYSATDTVIDEATWKDFDIVLLPNFMLPQIASASVDLVINVRSLSEMPAETIAEYLLQIDRVGRMLFFHENLYRTRSGPLHGIPSVHFPRMRNFVGVFSSDSRWPRYGYDSGYPCREHLLLHYDGSFGSLSGDGPDRSRSNLEVLNGN
jgi:putative sugar O-methyltransferase